MMLPVSSIVGRYLSSGEEDAIIRKEKIRRRNARIAQARDKAKVQAVKIFNAVHSERENDLKVLGARLKTEWMNEQEHKVAVVGEQYGQCLLQIGESHQDVVFEEARMELLMEKLSQDQMKSTLRGRAALKEVKYLKRQTLDDVKHKKEMRKKMRAYGDRANQLVSIPSDKQLPLILEKENRLPPDSGAKLIVDGDDERDARFAAEQEMKQSEECEQLLEQQKLKQNAKTRERYQLAMDELYRQKEMNNFVNKLEEIDDLNEYNINVTDLEKEREKAVEKLFENLGLPVKLSFLESSTERSSGITSDSTTVGDQETPARIIIIKRNVNSRPAVTPIGRVTRPSVTPASSSSTGSSSSTPYVSQSDSGMSKSSQISSSSSAHTDDEKRRNVALRLNENETILAGNLQSADSTINFTESSSNVWTVTDKSSVESPFSTIHQQTTEDPMSAKKQSDEANIILTQNNLQVGNQGDEESIELKGDPEEEMKERNDRLINVFHNVVIRKKSTEPESVTENIDNEADQRHQQLHTLVTMGVQSEKGLKVLTDPTGLQNQSTSGMPFINNIIHKRTNEFSLPLRDNTLINFPAINRTNYRSAFGLRRQHLDQELSTIIEMDTPRSSLISNLQYSPLTSGAKDLINTDSLFEMFSSENENGILEEPNLTLVSSITSVSDDQESSKERAATKIVPFIVTNVKSKTAEVHPVADKASSSHTPVFGLLGSAFMNRRAHSEGTPSTYTASSLGQTLTLDSMSWHSCMTDTGRPRLTHISPFSLSCSDSSILITDSSKSKSISNFNSHSSDNSITGELLSNSLISFLAHEMSANDSELDQNIT